MSSLRIYVAVVFVIVVFNAVNQFAVVAAEDGQRPNIVHIFADDLGWGSVGFTNPATHIETPNLDELAMAGMRLNRSYAATVCSPSRANLLTGFHSGHSANDRNSNIGAGLRAQDVTVGEILSQAGYRTAVVGKWGWGATGNRDLNGPDAIPSINDAESLPANQGFDIFYGFLNHSAAHDYYYDFIWESNSIGGATTFSNNDNGPGSTPEYSHDLTHLRSEELIRDLANGSEPFYLQISYTIPHFDLDDIQTAPAHLNLAGDQIFPAGLAQYLNDPNLSFREELHAAMISRMDASIGTVIDRLDDPNFDGDNSDSILENTIVFFTSDNGATPEDGLGGNSTRSLAISGGLRGGKRDLYEGGIRMPAFAYWPGTIAAGSSTDLINGLSDFQATAADLAGTKPRVGSDGVSIVPTLLNQPGQQLRNYLIFESHENSQLGFANADWAVVQQDFKLLRFDNGNYELYRIDQDREENSPLNLGIAANAAIRDEMEAIAIAEGAFQPDSYAVQFRQWVGADGDRLTASDSWSVTDNSGNPDVGAVDETWSAVVFNTTAAPATALLDQNANFLGLEIGGLSSQTIEMMAGTTLVARNQLRVEDNGVLSLQNASLQTNRRIEISEEAVLQGAGEIVGDVFNSGSVLATADASEAGNPGAGQFKFTVDFSGIDDRRDKDAFFTPLTGSIPQATISVDYGSSANSNLSDRGFNDFPAEFNLQNWSTDDQIETAIDGGRFFSLKVNPAPGLSVELVDAGFDFWRNGGNSPMQYAVFSNLQGFNEDSVLSQLTVGDTTSRRLTAAGTPGQGGTSDELEIRLYGWDAGSSNGHTHITGADVEMLFTESPLESFSGFTISGNYLEQPSANLRLEQVTDESVLMNVNGLANLAGSLSVQLADDFVPTAGEQLVLLNAALVTGQFDQIEIESNGFAISGNPVYSVSSVSFLFDDVCLLGDINKDGIVDLLDVAPFVELLLDGSFQTAADINRDGVVDLLDVAPFIDLILN